MFRKGNQDGGNATGNATNFTTLQPLGHTDGAFYYESPMYSQRTNNQPLYFASPPSFDPGCFNYLQSSSAGSFPCSEASSSQVPSQVVQFASSARRDLPGLDDERQQSTPSPVGSSHSSDSSATKKSWSRAETLALIDYYSNKRKYFRDPKVKNKQVWEEIAESMQTGGFSHYSVKECETKFKNLKRTYTTCVDHNKISGNDTKKCAFFEELQELFSKDDTFEPPAVCSNRKGYQKRRQADHSKDAGGATGTDSTTEDEENEEKEKKTKKQKQTPRRREGGELVTLFKEYTIAREESEQTKMKEMKIMHDEKMNVMGKFLDIFAKSIQKD